MSSQRMRHILGPQIRVGFQIMSDLHFELSQQYSDYRIPYSVNYLILNGDIESLYIYQVYLTFFHSKYSQSERASLVPEIMKYFAVMRVMGFRLAKALEDETVLKFISTILNKIRVEILDCTPHSSNNLEPGKS